MTIRCPYCRRRHRHHWRTWPQPPGRRLSHCRGRKPHPYEIGPVPPQPLLTVAADLRRTAAHLHRMPWLQDFTGADVVRVADAARALTAAVDRAIGRS